MKSKFIEIPVHEKTYRKSGLVRLETINTDFIVRFYTSDNHEFIDDTFIELSIKDNVHEIIRTSLPYDELRMILNIEKKCYLLASWDLDCILRSGKSPYVKVNLRRNGLKETSTRINNISDYHEVIDLSNPRSFWKMIYEVVDKQKFFLARIKLGF